MSAAFWIVLLAWPLVMIGCGVLGYWYGYDDGYRVGDGRGWLRCYDAFRSGDARESRRA